MKQLYNTFFIDVYLEKNKITKNEFCSRCGISLRTLRNIYNQKNMSSLYLIKVVNVLKISFYMFLGY